MIQRLKRFFALRCPDCGAVKGRCHSICYLCHFEQWRHQ